MEDNRIWNLMSKKMAGEATDAELKELAQLLREQPEAQYTMELMAAIWEKKDTSADTGDEVFDRYWPQLQAETALPGEVPRVFSLRKKVGWAAAALTGICLMAAGWLTWFTKGITHQPLANNEVTTHEGSRSKIKLPDGTAVWLNGGSKLTYSDDMKHALTREVYLTGEACFDVAKDAGKPFIIHTLKMQVNVLGTVLNVRSYSNESKAEATLVSGKIEVLMKEVPGQRIDLQPGEKLIIYNNQPAKKSKQPVVHYSVANAGKLPDDSILLAETSWIENKLVFNDEKMPDILRKMEHWYNVSIQVNNEKINDSHFTGSFQNETIAEALTAMQQIHHFQFTMKGKQVIIN